MSTFFFAFETGLLLKGGGTMLFKVMVAIAAYYVGKSGLNLNEFVAIAVTLLKLDDGE